jgi:hypothetical protein
MAEFVANGFLRFDAIVPDDINELAVEEIGRFNAGPGARQRLSGVRVRLRAEDRALVTAREVAPSPESPQLHAAALR